MAVQSNLYNISGTKTYHSTKPIATKAHMAVWLRQIDDGSIPVGELWKFANVISYDLINNNAVFIDSFDLSKYTHIEVRVADTPDELQNRPGDITIIVELEDEIIIVAGIAEEIVIVAGIAPEVVIVAGMEDAINEIVTEPLKSAVLSAEFNANLAQTESWEAEARAMTAASFAEEDFGTNVLIYQSNGDGTFTGITSTFFSAEHWAAQAQLAGSGLEYLGVWDASFGNYPADGTVIGQFYVVNKGGTIIDPVGATPVEYAVGDWMVWSDVTSDWNKIGWSYDWTSIANVPLNVSTAVGSDIVNYGGTQILNATYMTRSEYDSITIRPDAMYVIVG